MSTSSSLATSSTPAARRLLLLVAALACVVSAFSARDLWAPDEPRYGQVAREMVETGDWLVPHVNDRPYAEKPPLYYWAVAGLSAPFGGVSAVSARLAAALLAALAVLLTARLGRRLFGSADLGVTAALVFASMGLVLWNAPRAALDLPLTCLVLAAFDRALSWAEGRGAVHALLFGACWAGAVLLKGPVGLFLPPLLLAGGCLAARRAPRLADPGWWLAPLVMVGLCLAWVLPAVAAGGDAYADRLLGQVGDRMTGAEMGHRRGPLYYVLRLGPFALPWTLHLIAGLGALRVARRPTAHRFGLGAAAAGSLGLLIVLSLVATKRELYMIPGLPFAALLAAYALHHSVAVPWQRVGRWLLVACVAGLAIGVAAAPFAIAWVGRTRGIDGLESPDVLAGTAGVLAGLGLAVAAVRTWGLRERPRLAVWVGATALLLGSVFVHAAVLPRLDPAKSFARVAAAAEAASRGGPIAIAGWDQAPNLLWSLSRRRVGVFEDVGDVERALAAGGRPWAVVVERRWWERALADGLLGAGRVTWEGRVGNRRLVVLTNAAAPADPDGGGG